MTLPQRDRFHPDIAGKRTALSRLSAAGSGFVGAWRRPAAQSGTELRHLEAGLVLILCAAIVALAWFGDATVTQWARGVNPDVIWIFARITLLGTSGYIFATAFVILVGSVLLQSEAKPRRFNAALGWLAGRAGFIIAVNAVSGIVSQGLKHLFGRARPKLFEVVGPFHFDTFAMNATYASFPSGHAITSFGTALALGYFIPRLRWPLLALAVLIGISRIVIGAHYPSDVLAGAAIGTGTAILLRRAFLRRGLVFRRTARGVVTRGAACILPNLRRSEHP
jgi:undecaprenyl-diphosphatase